jgi:hypothetical protein
MPYWELFSAIVHHEGSYVAAQVAYRIYLRHDLAQWVGVPE